MRNLRQLRFTRDVENLKKDLKIEFCDLILLCSHFIDLFAKREKMLLIK